MKLLISIALLAVLAPDEKVELRWKWKKGQEIVYRSTQKNANEFMRQETGFTYSMTVLEVDEKGEAALEVKYKGVSSKIIGAQGTFEYDSEKDKEAPTQGPATILSKMVGQTFMLRMTPVGEITDIQGFEKILDAILGGLGDDVPGLREQMKQSFSNEAIKNAMQQMAPRLPEGKVGRGETWSNDYSSSMPGLGKTKVTVKSTFTELQDQVVTIQQEFTQGAVDKAPGQGELKEATGKSTLKFSLDRGLMLSQKSTMDAVISYGGQEMAMRTTVELRLVE